jgi:hypothetical protein
VFLERRIQMHAEGLNHAIDGGSSTLEARRVLEQIYATGGLPDLIARDAAHDFLLRIVTAQAQMLGFRDAFLAVGLACLLALLPALTLRQKPPGAVTRR